MAWKLDRHEAKQKQELVDKLTAQRADLDACIEIFNAELERLQEPVKESLEKLNELLEEAREFKEDVYSRLDGEYDGKSEKWQEGDRGQGVRQWIEQWSEASFDAIELETPEDIELDENDSADTLDQLQDSYED